MKTQCQNLDIGTNLETKFIFFWKHLVIDKPTFVYKMVSLTLFILVFTPLWKKLNSHHFTNDEHEAEYDLSKQVINCSWTQVQGSFYFPKSYNHALLTKTSHASKPQKNTWGASDSCHWVLQKTEVKIRSTIGKMNVLCNLKTQDRDHQFSVSKTSRIASSFHFSIIIFFYFIILGLVFSDAS